MSISILHPSRQRPDKSWRVTRDWISKAGSDVELIVSIDDNDPTRNDYQRHYLQADPMTTRLISNPNRSAIDAINNAAKVAKGDIMIVVSDDTECPHDWANKILRAVIGRKDYVLRVADGIQDWIITAPIIDRHYYNRFGYVYNPEYAHMFSDTEFTHVADMLGKIIRRDDIMFRHAHPCKGLATMDEVYRKNDQTFKQGQQVYMRRFKENFGLENVDPWNISGNNHLNWLRNVIR